MEKDFVSQDSTKHIVLLTDENYAPYTGVAIYSMIKNKNPESVYSINVLCNGVTEESKSKFKEMAGENAKINLIELEQNETLMGMKQTLERITKTALYKFLLPEIFHDLDKILYLDGDIIVKKDLSELYAQNIDEYYVGAVLDLTILKKPGAERKILNMQHDFYFNSGVMLLNLKLCREHNTKERLMAYRKNCYNYAMDQDALNVIFGARVLELGAKFNDNNIKYGVITREVIAEKYKEKAENFGKYEHKDVVILHMANTNKPWNRNMGYYTKLYLEYAQATPFSKYFSKGEACSKKSLCFYKLETALRRHKLARPIADFILISESKGFGEAIKKTPRFLCKLAKRRETRVQELGFADQTKVFHYAPSQELSLRLGGIELGYDYYPVYHTADFDGYIREVVDIDNIPYRDQYFDMEVVELAKKDFLDIGTVKKLVAETRRMLKNGGGYCDIHHKCA